MKISLTHNKLGFAVVEAMVFVLIAVGIVSAGYYVYQHRNDEAPTINTSGKASLGTVSKTDELNQSEINQEETIDSSYDAQAETNAVSDTTVMTNLGGASDGSDL